MQSTNGSEEVLPDYGLKFGYDPFWNGPLRVHRRPSDKLALFLGLVLFGGFIAVSFYAFGKERFLNENYKVMPNTLTEQSFENFVAMNAWARAAKTLFYQKWPILIALVLTLLLSLAVLMLLRVAAWVVVRSSIFVLLFLVLIGVCYLVYYFVIESSEVSRLLYLCLGIVLFMVLIFIVKIKAKFIPVCCEIVRESTRVMMFFPSLFLLSLLIWILSGCLIGWCTLMGAMLDLYFRQYKEERDEYLHKIYIFHAVNIVFVVLINLVLFAYFRMVAAGSYGTWYWTMDKRRVPHLTVISLVRIILVNHLGTAVLGGLIVHLCKFGRMVLGVFRVFGDKDVPNPLSYIVRCFVHYLNFIFVCVAMVDSYSDESYIFTALHGDGFCVSSKESFNLSRRNLGMIKVLRHMITILVLIATMVTWVIAGLLLWGLMVLFELNIKESRGVLSFVMVLMFLMIDIMFLMLDVACNTMFLCVCEDYERNKASLRPYYMSDNLRRLIIDRHLPE